MAVTLSWRRHHVFQSCVLKDLKDLHAALMTLGPQLQSLLELKSTGGEGWEMGWQVAEQGVKHDSRPNQQAEQ